MQTHFLKEFVDEARRFAGTLSARHDRAIVIALSGELGAGKTTYAQTLAQEFGIIDRVTSPTFVIEKMYDVPKPIRGFARLIHIDAYRLTSADELRSLGWSEILDDPRNLVLLEWPERVGELVPESAIRIRLVVVDSESRIISYE